MIDIATISSKGQIVLPKKVREEAGLVEQDKVLIISDKEQIILRKVSKEKAKKRLLELLDIISEKFKERNITEEDIQEAIKEVRDEKNKSRSRY